MDQSTAQPVPFRIPIQVTRPNSSGVSNAPDFLLCLIDHLLTESQQKAHATILKKSQTEPAASSRSEFKQLGAAATSGRESSNSNFTFSAPTPPALQRPLHDRLPLTLVVESGQMEGGVSSVTLMQTNQENEWRKANIERIEREMKRVQLVHVPLAHASRCPCRIAPTLDANGNVSTSISPNSSQPSSHPLFRLAVVVAPTLYSISHCPRCFPQSAPDNSPCMRALLTRRPNTMRAFPGCWVVPGGACDATDRSLEHTGTREVREETGLMIDEQTMQMVSLWEAVFPVIKPISDSGGKRFVAKARYLITMFSGEVQIRENHSLDHPFVPSSASSTSSAPTRSETRGRPVCVGCCVPLQLCSTEVDAACWVSRSEIPLLESLATYIHCEDEAALQKQDFTRSEVCGAGKEVCDCQTLPAMVTKQYALQYPQSTQVIEVSSSPSSSSSTSKSEKSKFVPARIRSCCLFGLYPNSKGSGVAEGHLVLLSEMNAKGLL